MDTNVAKPSAPQEGVGLAELDARLARIEKLIEPLAQAVQAGPAATAVLADTVDDWAARDGNFDQRLRGVLELTARLTEPATMDLLQQALAQTAALPQFVATAVDILDDATAGVAGSGQLDQRLRGVLELTAQLTEPGTLNLLQQVLTQAAALPQFVATAVDILDDSTTGAAGSGQLDQRLRGVLELVAQLTEPTTVELLQQTLAQATALPQFVATAVDILDGVAAEAAAAGMPVETLIATAGRALRALARVAAAPETQKLIASDRLAPQLLQLLGQLVHAVEAAPAEAEPVGLFGALRAARDADVQRALGFMLAVARGFGREVAANDHKAAPRQLEGRYA